MSLEQSALALVPEPESCDDCGSSLLELNRDDATGDLLCRSCHGRRQQNSLQVPFEGRACGALSQEQEEKNNKHPDPGQDPDPDGELDTTSPRAEVDGLRLGVRSAAVELFAELREAHAAGTLKPEPVQLGPVPPHFGPVERGVAEDVALLIGLRRAEGEHEPIPYPASAPVAIGVAPDKRRASLALRRLVNSGVLHQAGSLKKHKRGDLLLDGTKLYVPGVKR